MPETRLSIRGGCQTIVGGITIYLEIPLLARYTFNLAGALGLSRVYVDAGPYFGFLLSAKNTTGGMSSLYLDKSGTPLLLPPAGQPLPPVDFTASTDVRSDIQKVNTGITGGSVWHEVWDREICFSTHGARTGSGIYRPIRKTERTTRGASLSR